MSLIREQGKLLQAAVAVESRRTHEARFDSSNRTFPVITRWIALDGSMTGAGYLGRPSMLEEAGELRRGESSSVKCQVSNHQQVAKRRDVIISNRRTRRGVASRVVSRDRCRQSSQVRNQSTRGSYRAIEDHRPHGRRFPKGSTVTLLRARRVLEYSSK